MHRFDLAFATLLFLSACSPSGTKDGSAAPATATGSPAAAPAPDSYAMLSELTLAVRRYAAEQKKVPTSLDELVANNYLPAIPQPPPGKKFAIDKKLQVYLADK